MFKKIISTICASVFAFSCFGFNANAETDIINNEYSYTHECEFSCCWTNWSTVLSPFAKIKYTSELIFENAYQYTYRMISNEDMDIFMLWQRTEKKAQSGPSTPSDQVCMTDPIPLPREKYNFNISSDNVIYKEDYNIMYGFGRTSKGGIRQSSTNFSTNRPFIYAGDVIYECQVHLQTGGFPISDYQSIEYIKRRFNNSMKYDITNAVLSDIEYENLKLKEELESYKKIDFDNDGLLTNADAQMILVYYTNSLVGKTTGKVEDYSEYVKQISG